MSAVHVRVPATTANMGPGFDCFGCALSLYADFDCEIISQGLEITGCPEAYRNEDNLFVRAYRMAEDRMAVDHAPIRVQIRTDVPVSRGLGSSATLLAGGVAAANALNGGRLDAGEMLEICTILEGHPDNAAPALLGGMCASMMKDGHPIASSIRISERVGFIALIPNFETMTHDMRNVLPKTVAFSDAVYNVSRTAMLICAFESGDLGLISEALDDRLHQPYRAPLIHEYDRARQAALDAGCAAFCISGSGSTCLGIADSAKSEQIAERIQSSLQDSQYAWKVMALRVDPEGTVCGMK